MESFEFSLDIPNLLLPWYEASHRELPWRKDREPYHVWLSEIMLQQTRTEAVKSYYQRFLNELPTISALAECDEEKLMKLWEGLGYYSRARNLQKAAKDICTRFHGRLPERYEDILSLPGIGAYTAGAIASICFDQPVPAVDGNVLRVVSRLLGSQADILLTETKKAVTDGLLHIYPQTHPGVFTQALMELGAVICIPNGEPKCTECPLCPLCTVGRNGQWRDIPVRSPKKERRKEKKTVFLMVCGDKLAICKRPADGLLAGLWNFPNVPGDLEAQQALDQAALWGCAPKELVKCVHREHIFTHIHWKMTGYVILCGEEGPAFLWCSQQEIREKYSLPSAFGQFLTDLPII